MTLKSKEKGQIIFVVITLFVLFLLFKQGGFLGAFITQCDNNEPISITEYNYYFTNMSEGITALGTITVADESYITYTYNGMLGNFDLIDMYNISCSDFLINYKAEHNESQFISLDQRQVLTTSSGFMWCNYPNTIGLRAVNITTISDYYDEFIVCTTTEVDDNISTIINDTVIDSIYVQDNATCISMRGELIDGVCTCCDGSLLETGNICADPEDCDDSYTPSSSTITTTVVSTTNDTIKQTEADGDEYTSQQIFMALGVLVLAFIFYYFLFEKGPDKGLIQRKRRGKK